VCLCVCVSFSLDLFFSFAEPIGSTSCAAELCASLSGSAVASRGTSPETKPSPSRGWCDDLLFAWLLLMVFVVVVLFDFFFFIFFLLYRVGIFLLLIVRLLSLSLSLSVLVFSSRYVCLRLCSLSLSLSLSLALALSLSLTPSLIVHMHTLSLCSSSLNSPLHRPTQTLYHRMSQNQTRCSLHRLLTSNCPTRVVFQCL
jgi:hypothetical protein